MATHFMKDAVNKLLPYYNSKQPLNGKPSHQNSNSSVANNDNKAGTLVGNTINLLSKFLTSNSNNNKPEENKMRTMSSV